MEDRAASKRQFSRQRFICVFLYGRLQQVFYPPITLLKIKRFLGKLLYHTLSGIVSRESFTLRRAAAGSKQH